MCVCVTPGRNDSDRYEPSCAWPSNRRDLVHWGLLYVLAVFLLPDKKKKRGGGFSKVSALANLLHDVTV